MSNYEKDIKDLIEQMQRQQGGAPYTPSNTSDGNPHNKPPISEGGPVPSNFTGSPDQSPYLMNEGVNPRSPDQSPVNPINSVRPMGAPIGDKPPKPAGLKAVGDGCPQCGMMHPPVAAGQKCPMAGIKVKDEKGEEKEVDVNKFLAQLKNIIVSQVEQQQIKDVEKLFKNIIVEVTKFLEGYNGE